MVGPARKQRKPTTVKQSGTEYRMHFERKNKEELKMISKILPGHGTRKKPLLLTGKVKVIEKEDNKNTKKTDERAGYSISDTEKEKE